MKRPLMTVLLLLVTPVLAQITVEHELGTLELAATPQRIIGLENSFTDALLQLGVTPVGVTRDENPLPILDALTEGIPSVGSRAEPNLEALISLEPDLIIADLARHQDLYPQLSQIAPTIVLNSLYGSYEDILAQFKLIGDIVGQPERAEERLAEHRRILEEAKAMTDQDAGGLVAAVTYPGGFTVHSSKSFVGSLFERLGRQNLVEPLGDETQFEMSLEGLAAINPPALVIFRYADEETPVDEWENTSVWKSLQAVKTGRVYLFDRDNWTRARGLTALNASLKEAAESGLLADQPAPGGSEAKH